MKTLLTRTITLVLIGLSVWPLFTVISLGYSYFAGEGSVLNTWYLEPKRNLLTHFLDGWTHSAPLALAIAAIAVLCGTARKRLRWIRWLPLLLLPVIGIAIAQGFFAGNIAMLICLGITGFIVAIESLVLTRLMRSLSR